MLKILLVSLIVIVIIAILCSCKKEHYNSSETICNCGELFQNPSKYAQDLDHAKSMIASQCGYNKNDITINTISRPQGIDYIWSNNKNSTVGTFCSTTPNTKSCGGNIIVNCK